MAPYWLCILLPVFVGLAGVEGAKNYQQALSKSILFYDAQRSGKLPSNNPIHWRGDSGLHDCVTGGWYDAGDHVKFGLPMSFATTGLLWGFLEFKDGYQRAGQTNQMYDMIKWPLDYFLKAWNPNKKELVAQVGDGNADHSYWGRPEDMTMSRPCQRISSHNKGSDIAGGTAAAMAAGSIVWKAKGDNNYANKLLTAAKSLYTFAKSNRGVFNGAKPFYGSSGDEDEMCVGAMWLYKATHESHYLNDAKGFVYPYTAWGYGWDSKKIECQMLLFEQTKDSKYRHMVENFLKDWAPGGQVKYTPCGLAWRDQWGSARYAANSAFIALVAAEHGINAGSNRKWAVEQINYILGDNKHDGGCFSYEVGYGSKYPKQPHHRGASCPSKPATCNYKNQDLNAPNPHVIQGALVGGPDVNDNYTDRRTDYVHNEVAVDYNTGFQGALAGIVHLQGKGQLPSTNNKCKCNH